MSNKLQVHATIDTELKDKILAIREYYSEKLGVLNMKTSQAIEMLISKGVEKEGFTFEKVDGILVANK